MKGFIPKSITIMDDLLPVSIENIDLVSGDINMENYVVEIKKVENGFRVAVGCKEFVFKTLEELQEALELYFTYPKAAKEAYCRS